MYDEHPTPLAIKLQHALPKNPWHDDGLCKRGNACVIVNWSEVDARRSEEARQDDHGKLYGKEEQAIG